MREDEKPTVDNQKCPALSFVRFSERSKVCALIALSIVLCLPFLNQAFHIDDPTFLALARHSWPNPLDLYNFKINWLGTEQPAFEILSNPPLVPWYLACVDIIAGGREWIFHTAFLPFLALALEGVYRLAKRFSPSGSMRVVWWAIASPGLVVASHTLMPDLPLLAFLSFGIALAIEGLDRQQPGRAFAGSMLAGLSVLCKYSGIVAIPLLCLYTVLKRVRYSLALTALCGVLIPMTLWTAGSVSHYGRIHWMTIAGFQGQALETAPLVQKALYQITALSLAIALPVALRILISRGLPNCAKAGTVTGAATGLMLGTIMGLQLPAIGLLALGLAAGFAILALACRNFASIPKLIRRSTGVLDPTDGVFLSAWLLGILAFNLSLLFAAVRYLLPALPPALLLLDRSLFRSSKLRTIVAGSVALSVSLLLAESDKRLADGYREYAASLPASSQQRWFFGHHGLQYYMERTGAKAVDVSRPNLIRPGDEIIVPTYAMRSEPSKTFRSIVVDRKQFISPIPLRPVTLRGWASFHSSVIVAGVPAIVGLPYGVDSSPLETIARAVVIP